MKKVLYILVGLIVLFGIGYAYFGYVKREDQKIDLQRQQLEQQKKSPNTKTYTNEIPELPKPKNNTPAYNPNYEPSAPIYNGPTICETNVFGQVECEQKW